MKKIKVIPTTRETELSGIPPSPAIKHIPQWYKSIPPLFNNETKLRFPLNWETHNATVKKCVPFLDGMTAGYTFVLDDDLLVEQTSEGPFIRWKTDAVLITWHGQEQFDGVPIPKHYHKLVAKWHNDYKLVTPPGYSMLFTHPINRFDLPFKTMTGVVDTDTYAIPVQFPFFLEEGFEGIIKSGTPVAQMIPFKREEWQLEHGTYDADEAYKDVRMVKRTFANSYKLNFWHRKSYS